MGKIKEMLIIVRPEKAMETEALLLNHGAHYVTRQSVTGRGKEMGLKILPAWFGTRRKSSSYLRKTLFSSWIDTDRIPHLQQEIIRKNKTGQFGDGKIFILPSLGRMD